MRICIVKVAAVVLVGKSAKRDAANSMAFSGSPRSKNSSDFLDNLDDKSWKTEGSPVPASGLVNNAFMDGSSCSSRFRSIFSAWNC